MKRLKQSLRRNRLKFLSAFRLPRKKKVGISQLFTLIMISKSGEVFFTWKLSITADLEFLKRHSNRKSISYDGLSGITRFFCKSIAIFNIIHGRIYNGDIASFSKAPYIIALDLLRSLCLFFISK